MILNGKNQEITKDSLNLWRDHFKYRYESCIEEVKLLDLFHKHLNIVPSLIGVFTAYQLKIKLIRKDHI